MINANFAGHHIREFIVLEPLSPFFPVFVELFIGPIFFVFKPMFLPQPYHFYLFHPKTIAISGTETCIPVFPKCHRFDGPDR
jgi:hypothetical protein